MCAPCSPRPCCNQSNGAVCGDKDQALRGLSAAAPTGPDDISLALLERDLLVVQKISYIEIMVVLLLLLLVVDLEVETSRIPLL